MDGIGFVLDEVTIRRGGRPALQGVTWEVRPGERWGVVGPNGAGKSTLLLALAGVLEPASGRIRRRLPDGTPPRSGEVGLLLQRHPEPPAVPVSALEMAALGGVGRVGRAEARRRAVEALDRLGMGGVRARRFDRLSGGQRGRVHLARLVVQRPRALLLDEPAAGLDPLARVELAALLDELVRRWAVTVVAVAHDLGHLPASTTHVAALREGRLVAAGPWEDVVRPEVLERAFGVPVRLHPMEGDGVVLALRRPGAAG